MPSHHFPPNLLDTSCLCKRFVVFDISVLLLQLRGVWRLHNFASQESTSGSMISVTLSRNGSSVGAKVSHKPACLQVVHVFLDPGNKKKRKNTVQSVTLSVLFVHVPLVLPHKQFF